METVALLYCSLGRGNPNMVLKVLSTYNLRELNIMFTKRCTKCLMPENYPNISFNSNGVCSYCLGEQHFGVMNDPKIRRTMVEKESLREDFETTVRECRGQGEYDCLVPLSGGKDSSYLVYLLQQQYGLKVLTLTVDTGLLSPRAIPNIERVITRLNVDHILFTPKADFFKKLYHYFLTHVKFERKKYEEIGYTGTVCHSCCEAIHSIALRVAAERGIPFVALGYSPDQIEYYFYEAPQEDIYQRGWLPPELNDDPFDEEDRSYFWDSSSRTEGGNLPRLLFPYHVLEYPKEVAKSVVELGLIQKGNASPLVTNCQLSLLLMYLDIKKLGYNPYISSISYLVREGRISRRRLLLAIEGGNLLVKSGMASIFLKRKINHVLEYLNLEMKELV